MSPDETPEFHFKNTSESNGTRSFLKDTYSWFKWSVYMNEPPEKLALVDYVEYRLHDTFPDPVRVAENADDKFSLSSAGWGEFTIFITVYLKDGREVETTHYLKL